MKVIVNKLITVLILITADSTYSTDKDNFKIPSCLSCRNKPISSTEESNKIQNLTHNITQASHSSQSSTNNQNETRNTDKNNVGKTIITTTNNKQKDFNEIQVVSGSKQLQNMNKFQKNNKLDTPSEWLNDFQNCDLSLHTIRSYKNPECYYKDNILNLPVNFSFVNEDGSYKCYDELMQIYNDPEDYNDSIDFNNIEILHSIENNKEINKETLKNCNPPVEGKETPKFYNIPVKEKEMAIIHNPLVEDIKMPKIFKLPVEEKATPKFYNIPVKEKEIAIIHNPLVEDKKMPKIFKLPVEEKATPKFYNIVKEKKNNKIDRPLGKKRGRYKKNDSYPKNTAIKSKHGIHGRKSKDNCIQKVKVLVLDNLREFINKKIRKVCKRGFMGGKLLQKIDPKYYSSCKYSSMLMNKSIKDILSCNLGSKIKHLEKGYNRKLIEELEKDNKVAIINILNKTFIQALEHFSGKSKYKEFEGMETFDEWVNKNSEDDVEYAEDFKYVVKNFEKIVEETKRRPGNKNSKIDEELEAFYSNSENANNIKDKTRQDNVTTTIHQNNDKSQVGNVFPEDSDFKIEIS